ncbi:MAG: HesA/MoeB/ThiF family protein [Euryarchaeota archaeon]|nr:HesA/MoeB/ThiF family protein [Euryarchaeota archaeon]
MGKDRYRRQTLVKEFGQKGQKLLASKHAILIGGGGLGSNSANLLIRMGIGSIDIIDYDTIDKTNLHRTSVFSEKDIGEKKASILKEKLQSVNTDVKVKAINKKVTSKNIDSLISNADVIIDGTDNIPLRLLINERAIKHKIPWVYAGVFETVGMVMAILPKKTACFHCITPIIPVSKTQEIPVLGSLPATIAAIQCNETIKILMGKQPAGLIIYDVWNQCFDVLNIKRNPCCPICGKK